MAEAGQFDRAVDVAEMIDNLVVRLQVLADILAAKRGEGNQDAAAK
jgi:hypothetical protein